jgi:hypothetical protein
LNEHDIGPEATPAEVPAAPVKETASPIPKATPEPEAAASNGLTKTDPEAEGPASAPGAPTKTTTAGRPKKAKTAKASPKKKKKATAKGKAKKAKR